MPSIYIFQNNINIYLIQKSLAKRIEMPRGLHAKEIDFSSSNLNILFEYEWAVITCNSSNITISYL